jgi:N-acetylglucosamine-6-sulfatase
MHNQTLCVLRWRAASVVSVLTLFTMAASLQVALTTVSASPPPTASTTQPNIVFILTDDLDAHSIQYMPNVQALLADQGVTLENYLVSVPLCCPSRTSTLRGQYAHNTQVTSNWLPEGGFEKVYQLGLEHSTVATWLQAAGYQTMLAGKYLNRYPSGAALTYIPPGWSEWYSSVQGNAYREFNYTLNENGTLVSYGNTPEDYGTDVYGRKAVDFIQRMAQAGNPFFIYLAPYAPHEPLTPAPRHADLFPGAKAPRTLSFNEADVSDKAQYIRNWPLLNDAEIAVIDQYYRKRLQSLQAVDEMIAHLVTTLIATGQLDHTYIFFTSDNGFHLGQHRLLAGKEVPYEEDIRVTLLVRGPGVPEGKTRDHLTGNIDLAPTWAELTGAQAADFVDGRSLVSLLGNNPPLERAWRQAFLLQHVSPSQTPVSDGQQSELTAPPPHDKGLEEPPDPYDRPPLYKRSKDIPAFVGLRTQLYTYIEYVTGERELYDLKKDPYQLQNLASAASPTLLQQLATQLAALRQCAADSCRTAENTRMRRVSMRRTGIGSRGNLRSSRKVKDQGPKSNKM